MRRIVCIGDSITYGQRLTDRRLAWPALITGYDVSAYGIPGDTTRHGLERFPTEVQQQKAFITVIQFGHNDANRWASDLGLPRVSPRSFEANLREMVERCTVFGTIPLLCSITPSQKSEQHSIDVEVYDLILRGVASDTNTMLIDVRSVFMASNPTDLLMPDGIHLNEAGHRLYADVVQQVLDAWR